MKGAIFCASLATAAPAEPLLSLRERSIKEILVSERTYVASLQTLVEVFIAALRRDEPTFVGPPPPPVTKGRSFRKMKIQPSASVALPNSVIQSSESSLNDLPKLELLFKDAEVLLGVNQRFLGELENANALIGDLFLRFAPFFRMYTQFVNHHEGGLKQLRDVRSRESSRVSRLLAQLAARGYPHDIESLLILPIQRIPRYRLLLEAVLSHTSPEHADRDALERSLVLVQRVATQINDAVHARQNRDQILDIQRRFNGRIVLVAPHRRLVRQGPLVKVCRSSLREYEFFLFNDMLLYTKDHGALGGLKLHRRLPINAAFCVEDVPPADEEADQHRFRVRTIQKSFEVIAESHLVKVEWLIAISEAILEQSKNRRRSTNTCPIPRSPTRESPVDRDPSTAAAPVWVPDAVQRTCTLCAASFTLIKRRHHCRLCGVLICGACSRGRLVLEADVAGSTSSSSGPQRVCDACFSSSQAREKHSYEHSAIPHSQLNFPVSPHMPTRRAVSPFTAPSPLDLSEAAPPSMRESTVKLAKEAAAIAAAAAVSSTSSSTCENDFRNAESELDYTIDDEEASDDDHSGDDIDLSQHDEQSILELLGSLGIGSRTAAALPPSIEIVRALTSSDDSSNVTTALHFDSGDLIAAGLVDKSGWRLGMNTRTNGWGWYLPQNTETVLISALHPLYAREPRRHSTITSLGCIATTIYAFNGADQATLSFEEGDRIEVTDRPSADWWMGRVLNSISSSHTQSSHDVGVPMLFPSDRVRPLRGEPPSTQAYGMSVVVATQSYTGRSMLRLSLRQRVVILDTRDPLWWFGELINGQRGWFPSAYVQLVAFDDLTEVIGDARSSSQTQSRFVASDYYQDRPNLQCAKNMNTEDGHVYPVISQGDVGACSFEECLCPVFKPHIFSATRCQLCTHSEHAHRTCNEA